MNYLYFNELSAVTAENCGIAILNPGWMHPERNLDSSVLLFGKKSDIEIQEEQESLHLSPSSSVILASGCTHKGLKKLEKTASYYWIHFNSPEPPQFITGKNAALILGSKEIAAAQLKNALLIPQEFNFQQGEIIKESFHELLYEQENPSFSNYKYQLLFKLLLIRINEMVLSDHIQDSESQRSGSVVNSIIQIVYENLTDTDFSVKRLASDLQYNPDYLGRVFKSVMKKSIIEYIIDKRIEHAAKILTEQNETVNAVAQLSGFSSSRNFIRQFKNRTGMTPSEFRLRHKMMHITNI